MSARDRVMGKVRRALAVGSAPERQSLVHRRLAEPTPNLIPARGQLPPLERVDLFCRMAEKASASLHRLGSPEEIPAAIAEHLRRHNLPLSLRMGGDPRLRPLPWEDEPHLERLFGPSDGRDLVALSHAAAGVAETGTLVLLSGPDNPTTLNFLPDTHIVVVRVVDILGDYESIWQRLRAEYGSGLLPRTVNFITGPSRSADIEQTIILGAHGPRALHILVVE